MAQLVGLVKKVQVLILYMKQKETCSNSLSSDSLKKQNETCSNRGPQQTLATLFARSLGRIDHSNLKCLKVNQNTGINDI